MNWIFLENWSANQLRRQTSSRPSRILIIWQKLPMEKRITRITQKANFDKLLESGLLGPVELRAVR